MDTLVEEVLDDYATAKQHLANLADAVIWMSGSDSFSPGNEAHDVWAEVMRPRLFAALEWMEVHQP